MKKENKYAVIGGQYHNVYYGCTPTLQGAKRLATQNEEYWDNYIGKHTPIIKKIEDTNEIDGARYPKHDGSPYFEKSSGKWKLIKL